MDFRGQLITTFQELNSKVRLWWEFYFSEKVQPNCQMKESVIHLILPVPYTVFPHIVSAETILF